ncbi:MAG: hypothetical protein M3R65_10475 [Gemmatimonadota bacterium]|nr:hypothetical protein [Gemmatimonadota bacterium]
MKFTFVSVALRGASIAAVPVAMLSMTAASASAQGYGARELFDWRGAVDQEIRIEMQGGRTSTIAMGPREMVGYDNARAVGGVPSTNGYVTVEMREGRGIADVVQQPTARNGYTTIVRIRDGESGAGRYDVAAFWQPSGNAGYGYGNTAAYGQYGTDGRYDAYDRDARYGNYGNYGNYGTYGYPQTVIVQRPVYQQPVYQQPVYGNVGKTLPSRGSVYQQPVYSNDGRYSRYPSGNVQAGKTLPGVSQDRQRGTYNQSQASQNAQTGKTLPATNGSSQRNGYWQHNH